jgi:hypothetical protein
MKKVFLGGTCNDSDWRDVLIPALTIDYYNPVVPDWTEECYQRELREREECDYCLYVITPKMTGAYSIAEVIDDSNKRPEKTVFAFLFDDDGAVFDARAVRENAINLYWALKPYEDTGLTPEEIIDGKMLTGWIPVEERLPEHGKEVLAYIKHNYMEDGWRAYRVYEYTDHWVGMGNLCEVIAWMPLPEPYRETN